MSEQATNSNNQSPLAEEIRPLVDKLSNELEQLSYYKLLGVGRGASMTAIQQAFYRRAVQLHPDRHFRLQDKDLKAKITAVYKRIAEGYRVLSSPMLRKKYDRGLRRGENRVRPDAYDAPSEHTPSKPSPPTPSPINDDQASVLFSQAQEQIQAHKFAEAETLLKKALALCPDSAKIKRKLEDATRLKRLWTQH
jgi:curved DNA-binding protein CbpA